MATSCPTARTLSCSWMHFATHVRATEDGGALAISGDVYAAAGGRSNVMKPRVGGADCDMEGVVGHPSALPGFAVCQLVNSTHPIPVDNVDGDMVEVPAAQALVLDLLRIIF